MKTYTAVCERDESGTWVITVPKLRGVVTQSRRLDKAVALTADAIALWLNTTPDQVNVELDVHLADDAAVAAAAVKLRREAEALQIEAVEAARTAARQLVERDGLSLRDAAVVLDLSHQRVQQLLSGNKGSGTVRSRNNKPVTRSNHNSVTKRAAASKKVGSPRARNA